MALISLKQLDSVLTGSLQVSGSSHVTGSLSVQGSLFGPIDDHFDIKSDKNIRLYLDKDNDTASSKFTVLDGGGSVRFQVQEDGKTSIGGDVDASSNFVKILTGNVTASGDISGSSTSTGSFGRVEADGVVYADSFQSVTGGTTIDFNDSLDIAGDVTASGHISASGDITGSNLYSSGRIFEQGSSVIDHATAMAIVFGG